MIIFGGRILSFDGLASNNPPHGRIASKTLGVVHVFIPAKACYTPIDVIDPSCRAIRSCRYGCLGKHSRKPRSGQGDHQALDRRENHHRKLSWNREIPLSSGGRNQPVREAVCFHPPGDPGFVCSDVCIALILIAESSRPRMKYRDHSGNGGLGNKFFNFFSNWKIFEKD